MYVRHYLLAGTWWAWVIYPLAWHSSLVQRKRLFLKFPFYAILSEFVLAGVEERAWGSAGYERFEATSGDEAFGPLQVQYPVGACTPQELERSCQQTAHGAEHNLVCSNCNHFAARVLSRLGLSAWRRWLVLGLVASMVPLGYQVPGTRAWQTIIGTSGIGTTYRLDY